MGPNPPLRCGLCFFTVPILAYIIRGGENMNGGVKKHEHWTSVETPLPHVD